MRIRKTKIDGGVKIEGVIPGKYVEGTAPHIELLLRGKTKSRIHLSSPPEGFTIQEFLQFSNEINSMRETIAQQLAE